MCNRKRLGSNPRGGSILKMIKKVRVMTRPKANTLDPQGVVVKGELERSLGIKFLKKVSVGRYIEILVEDGPEEDVKNNIQEAIDKLLYNSIIEDYEVIYENETNN
jgi:phosphoribosylformylglycinamidine synthase PurS subunit